jgi:hypothetical protein
MMDCRQALAQLGDLSAEGLPVRSAQEIIAHMEQCPECEKEWELFRKTLFLASTTTQPLLTAQQSQQIWGVCLQKIIEKTEAERTTVRSPFLGWFTGQPRLGWAALGGAIAVFGSVWAFTPHGSAPRTPTTIAQFDTSTNFVRFENPPRNTAALVNNHAAMAFDPFNDHVGSTLVSYSATAE